MDETNKWYWKFKDRLRDLGYLKLGNRIAELEKEREKILNKVIAEFSEEQSLGVHAPDKMRGIDEGSEGSGSGSEKADEGEL